MLNDPLISVITTVYNCEKYLRESIESILNQTFTDFEFIIINDGSTDSSASIVRSYNDNRIRFYDNSENHRIPRRRNEAILLAKGKFIAIHDGDDISLPKRFETQIKIINGGCLFCIGGHAIRIDLDGNQTGLMNYPAELHRSIVYMILHKCMNPIIDPTTIFVKDSFLKLGGYTLNKEIYTVPDFDLWARAISANMRFLNVQEPVIKYRRNPDSMTGVHKKEMITQHMIVWTRFCQDYYEMLRDVKRIIT